MKRFKLSVVILSIICMFCCLFTACDNEVEATVTGKYLSSQNVSYRTFLPTFNYKTMTIGHETLTLYSDGTYVIVLETDTLKGGAGSLSFPDEITSEAPVTYELGGSAEKTYYGTYTSTNEDGIITVELATPTRIVTCSINTVSEQAITYVDTANWTDAMATEDVADAAAYLSANAFEAVTIIVVESTGLFDYVALK